MAALEDSMNSIIHYKDLIKMEVDIDEEDILDACLEEEDEEDDPLLMLKPIVYTTKLDEMRIVKKDLREFNPQQITEMLISESQPKFTPKHMKNSSKSENLESYEKLLGVLQQLNLKTKIKAHSIYVRNLKLWNQCKPFRIVIEDIKNAFMASKQVEALNHIPNVSESEPTMIVSSHGVSEVSVKVESLDSSDNDANSTQIKQEAIEPPWTETRTIFRQIKSEIIDISYETSKTLPGTEKNVPIENAIPGTDENISNENNISGTDENESKIPTTEENVSIENNKNNSQSRVTPLPLAKNKKTIEPQHIEVEIESPAKKKKKYENKSKKIKRGRPPSTKQPDSSEEDNVALVDLKRKPAIAAAIAAVNVPPAQSIFDKYTLIVLVHKKKKAFVYRVNPTKLISDYFITKVYDEYKLAAMYPKEEKIVEHYCCWFNREEVITKICTRKSYSFTIQKFLRLSHSCAPGNCKCCCVMKKDSKESEQTQERKRVAANESLAVADSWIRGLLDRNQVNANVGLVAKAMNFIPKAQVKANPIAKETVKYLEFVILWMKNTGSCDVFDNIPELYEIGKNGDVVRSFVIDTQEKCTHIRRTYLLMGLQTMEAKFCCWYTRDKLMTDLRLAKMSPTALKLVQVSHICERNNCKCCCKPQIKSLRAIDTLPKILKHTTAYEKNAQPLTIRFNVTSKTVGKKLKVQGNNRNLKKIQNNKDTSTAVLSSPMEKRDDDDNLSTTILSKYKNLKLGVSSDGKLEAVLKAPARNLSIGELKVLSDILAFSTKQIAELRILPEEFCERINSKSAQANDDVISEISEISDSEIEPPQIEPQKIASPVKTPPSLKPSTQPKKQIRMTPTCTTNTDYSKTVSNMYSSMTNLMEKKNKCYVDSFKSFFNNVVSSNVVVPETNKFVPVISIPRRTAPTQPALPKITETFTLSKPPTELPLTDTAGPSGTTGQLDSVQSFTPKVVSIASLKTHNTRSAAGTNKRKLPFDYEAVDKNIRVKTASEQKSQKKEEPATTGTTNSESNPVPFWPTPIVIKREPQSNIQTIVNSAKSVPRQINPNLQANSFLIGNNVVPASNIIVSTTLNNVYQVKESGLVTKAETTHSYNRATGTTQQPTGNNASVRVLTLTPITTTKNNTAINKTMLAQILKKPQVQPITASTESSLPPLVPFKPANIAPKLTPKIVSQPRPKGNLKKGSQES